MTYTEDQLTGWFDVTEQKPWEPGVYRVKIEHMPECDGLFSFFNGVEFKWISKSIDGAYEHQCMKTGAVVTKWRGLSQNPNAKPKRSGNKRKVMYVVQEIANNGMLLRSLASFRDMKHAKSYAASVYCYTRIDKIRFRTPEQE